MSIASGLELRPRQLDQPVEIGADHPVFGGRVGHALEPLELLLGLLLGFLRHAGLVDLLAQLAELDRLLVTFAQLLLDLPELLAQDVLALLRGERLLGLLADLLRQLQHLDALRQQRQHLVEALLDVDGLEHFLLFRRLRIDDAGDEVGQRRRQFQAVDRGRHLRRDVRQQLHRLARALADQARARLDLRRHHLGDADLLDPRHQKRIAREEFEHAEAPQALGDHVMSAVGRGDVAQDLRGRPELVELLRRRLVGTGIQLQDDAERPLGAHRLLRGSDRRLAADRERQHETGEQHGLPDRKDDHRVRRQGWMLPALPDRSLICLLCHLLRQLG